MGPITLFDKSFLQGLTVDESVWFDHFFLAVVSPFFYVETLADLEKSVRARRTADQYVRVIADKFPEMHGTPCSFHVSLAIANLLGAPVPMNGRIPLAGGRLVKSGGRTAAMYDESPEACAFRRWQEAEFVELERAFARAWRRSLSSATRGELTSKLREIGLRGESSRTLADAKAATDELLCESSRTDQLLRFLLFLLGASSQVSSDIISRWDAAGTPNLLSFAPYAAHVLAVEVFFQAAVSAGLISRARPSNRVDIAYLFYLPFCMFFVSSDRLHRRSAPLFLRPDQRFVWGPDLKTDLGRIDQHFSGLPESVRQTGVMRFARTPPVEGPLTTSLWDSCMPRWREKLLRPLKPSPEALSRLANEMSALSEARELRQEEVDFMPDESDALAVKRVVRGQKGSWRQLPEDIAVHGKAGGSEKTGGDL